MGPSELFRELDKFKGKEYETYKKGLDGAARENITLLCGLFENASYDVRRDLVSRVVREISFLFLTFSGAMAEAAVRQCDKQCVVRGLEALAIENCVGDWRDSTLRLVLLHHSAQKIGADPKELIGFVAALAMDTAQKNLFAPFLARNPEDKQLDKFGLKEAVTPNGEFTYASVH